MGSRLGFIRVKLKVKVKVRVRVIRVRVRLMRVRVIRVRVRLIFHLLDVIRFCLDDEVLDCNRVLGLGTCL